LGQLLPAMVQQKGALGGEGDEVRECKVVERAEEARGEPGEPQRVRAMCRRVGREKIEEAKVW